MISQKHLKKFFFDLPLQFPRLFLYSYDDGLDDTADGAISAALHRNNVYRRLREKDTSLTEIE